MIEIMTETSAGNVCLFEFVSLFVLLFSVKWLENGAIYVPHPRTQFMTGTTLPRKDKQQ